MLIDTATNTKIVYLFINSFDWASQMDHERAVGNPKPGRLYRAVKNTDTNSYRVIYPIDKTFQGIVIERLENDDMGRGYIADIKEITIDNILDFNISEEDLTIFVKWLRTGNKDLKEWMGDYFKSSNSQTVAVKGKTVVEAVIALLRERDPELASVIASIDELRKKDEAQYIALGQYVNFVLTKEEPETSISPDWIRADPMLGAGANLSSAITKLGRYGSADRRTNYDSKDLLGAVYDLLYEQYRLLLYERRH